MTPSEHLADLKRVINIPSGVTWDEMVKKYIDGLENHKDEPRLWEMSDEELDANILGEKKDLAFYNAEKTLRALRMSGMERS